MEPTSLTGSNVRVSCFVIVVVTMPDFPGEEVTLSNVPRVTQV